MGKLKTISDVDFIEAVETSTSIRSLLIKLDVIPAGGNYHTVKHRLNRLEISTDHFLGQGHLKGKSSSPWHFETPLEDIIVKNSTYKGGSYKLKNKLFKVGLLEKKCNSCKLEEWKRQPIALELEHINGNSYDNRIENLIVLCPNCHAQTPTYRGKNKRK